MKLTSKLLAFLLLLGLLLFTSSTISLANDTSPAVPAIASFILPGAGQFINDQPDKALTHFVIGVGIYSIYSLPFVWRSSLYRVLPVLNLAWSGYSAYDAYQVAAARTGESFEPSLQLNPGSDYDSSFEVSSAGISTGMPQLSVSALSDMH